MTDAAFIENITRRFCELRGIDPDAHTLIPCPDGQPGCCVAHFGPTWKNYVSQVQDGIAMIEALTHTAPGCQEKP